LNFATTNIKNAPKLKSETKTYLLLLMTELFLMLKILATVLDSFLLSAFQLIIAKGGKDIGRKKIANECKLCLKKAIFCTDKYCNATNSRQIYVPSS
jgi:hypothetical protein